MQVFITSLVRPPNFDINTHLI